MMFENYMDEIPVVAGLLWGALKRSQMFDGPDRSDRDEDIPIRAKSVQLEC
ncbi:hypothetical protein P368_08245 [Comamonas thiooxydans]|nr:hypothetical protein P369_09150 [Comamonas thiooxydans]KGG98677.1 hypothetical protein P367_12055 [Comamonas thiooxydans]KGH04994.1 hypothetical protein P365_12215 [Comamonas thiooxydans]KGH13777.1 hypothetical protein P368_08245 [Comamonas thiooxydans]